MTLVSPGDHDGQSGPAEQILWIMFMLAVLSTYTDLVGLFRG